MAESKGLLLVLGLLTIGGVALVKRAKAQPPNGNGSECDIDAHCVDLYGPGYVCENGVCIPETPPPPECVVDLDCAPGYVCVGGVCVPEGVSPVGEALIEVMNFSAPAEVCVGGQATVYFDLVNNGGEAGVIQWISVCTKGWCAPMQRPGYTLLPGQSRSFSATLTMGYLGLEDFEIAVERTDGIRTIYVSDPISVIEC